MAHFDADQETVDRLKKCGWKKPSPLDILDPNEVSFVLSPEELGGTETIFFSEGVAGFRPGNLKPSGTITNDNREVAR